MDLKKSLKTIISQYLSEKGTKVYLTLKNFIQISLDNDNLNISLEFNLTN